MWIWVLTIYIGAAPLDAGEYQERWRCVNAALMQLPHWRAEHIGTQVTWTCEPILKS